MENIKNNLKRFWVRWYQSEDLVKENFPFKHWITGYTSDDRTIYCSLIEAESEEAVEEIVYEYFGNEVEFSFIDERDKDWEPPKDRFR